MSIILRQEEIDNRWLTWVAFNELDCLLFETENKLTEEEAQAKLNEALNPPEEQDGTTN